MVCRRATRSTRGIQRVARRQGGGRRRRSQRRRPPWRLRDALTPPTGDALTARRIAHQLDVPQSVPTMSPPTDLAAIATNLLGEPVATLDTERISRRQT